MHSSVLKNITSSVVAIVVLTAALGFGYPALMTGIAQVAFSNQANGSLISVNGKGAATLRFTVTGPVDAALKKISEFPVLDLTSRLPDLEDVFMTFYAGGGDDAA
jgi:hypothetical protein